jgi:NAD(P)-dependent dehydrogenase (short-subunit alcohol dehydrogenase family)/acyl carrier protein
MEALARLQVPPSAAGDFRRYRFHPALLDAVWQVIAAAVPGDQGEDHGVPWVPVGLGALEMLAPPTERMWSHARLESDTEDMDLISGEVTLYDEGGRLLAVSRGLAARRLESVAAADETASATGFHELSWVPQEATPEGEAALATGAWLLLAEEKEPAATALAERISGDGGTVLWRPPAEGFAVDLPADLRGVVFFAPEAEDPREGVPRILAPVLSAVRRLARPGGTPAPALWLVTRGGVATDGHAPVSVAHGSLWGLGRTLAAEHPAHWGGLFDLDPQGGQSAAAAALWRQMLHPDGEDQIAWRQGRRLVPRLQPWSEEAGAAEIPVTPDGAYLITGGLGDLGLAVAGHLVQRGARHLWLLGRHGLPPRILWPELEPGSRLAQQVAAVQALEAQGAAVHGPALDVADAAAFSALLRSFGRDGVPPLRGVIHAAGVVDFQNVEALTPAEVEAVLRPKVDGGWVLHRETRQAPLDFFVLFSSISSLVPSPRLAHYAAANAFLDALAQARRAEGLPAVSIHWPAWKEIGMAAREMEADRVGSFASLTTAEGLAALDRLATAAAPQVAILQGEAEGLPPLFAHLTARRESPAVAAEGPLADLLAAPEGERAARLETTVAAIAGQVLGISATRLDVQQPLQEMGLDSLMAVEIKNRIQSQLGLTLSAVELLHGPSVVELAALLLGRLPAAGGAGGEPADPGAGDLRADALDSAKAQDLLARIDQLSEEEVQQLLEQNLLLEEVAE